jgi:hypothetical protein
MPIPFTLGLFISIGVCMLSKFQHPHTFLSVSTYSICAMLCILMNIYYFINFVLVSIEISTILLIISLVINFILNALFLVLIKFTVLRDLEFKKFLISHKQSCIIFTFGALTTNTNYVIFFSRLFDFTIFKAHLENIFNLRVINYLWLGQILVYILGTSAGLVRLIYLK